MIPPYARLLIAGLALMVHTTDAAELYLEHKNVTGSRFFTGEPGSAEAAPMGSAHWITMHEGNTRDLAIRDFGFVIEDDRLNELVYGIANRLLAQWPGTVPPFAIFVQGDRSPLVYSASTAYTREIFISYGVFLHAESVDELAAVIGHELAHMLLEHSDALGMRKSILNALDSMTRARNLYAKAEALRFDDTRWEISLDASVAADLQKSATQRVIADLLYERIHATLFSRGAEHEADRLALDLMIAAGYSPMGLKISLERMAHSHDLATEVAAYFEESSKTLLQQTLAIIDQQLSQQEFRPEELDAFITNTQEAFMKSTVEFGTNALIKFSAKSHPVPAKRVRKITQYLYDNYPRSVRRRQPDSASVALFRSGHIAAVMNNYSAANQAVEAIGQGLFTSADELTADALSAPTYDDPYIRYTAFLNSRSQGDPLAAVAELEEMRADGLVPVQTSAELADFLVDNGRVEFVNRMIGLYEGYFGEIHDYYPPKIKLSAAAEDHASVESLALACYEVAPPDSTLARKCATASGVSPMVAESAPEDQPGLLKPANQLKNLFQKP